MSSAIQIRRRDTQGPSSHKSASSRHSPTEQSQKPATQQQPNAVPRYLGGNAQQNTPAIQANTNPSLSSAPASAAEVTQTAQVTQQEQPVAPAEAIHETADTQANVTETTATSETSPEPAIPEEEVKPEPSVAPNQASEIPLTELTPGETQTRENLQAQSETQAAETTSSLTPQEQTESATTTQTEASAETATALATTTATAPEATQAEPPTTTETAETESRAETGTEPSQTEQTTTQTGDLKAQQQAADEGGDEIAERNAAAEGATTEPEAAGAETETQATAADLEADTGATETTTAAAGGSMPAMAGETGGGSAATAGGAGGGELQGGSEEEGASELEERLARADPERAVADEADPAEVARGEPIVEADEEAVATPEIPDPSVSSAEVSSQSELPEATGESIETPASEPTQTTSDSATTESMRGEAVNETADSATTPEEEPDTADGFSGDEPALGSGALEHSPTLPELSEPEKQAAMGSLGESTGGGGEAGGGGGGGGAVPEKPAPEVPDVANQEPSAALATVGSLPPVQLKQALGGVNAAVGKSAGDKRTELAANPPKMERPTGSPKNLHGQTQAHTETTGEEEKKVEQAPEGQDQPTPEPQALPEPPPSPAESIREPPVTGGEGGKLSKSDVSRMSDSMGSLPTQDPGLHPPREPVPQVELSGNADPAQTDQQQTELQTSVNAAQTQGRADVAQEMGENTKIYPSVPPETLTAQVPQAGGTAAGNAEGAAAAGGSTDPEALSIIAQRDKGGEIQAALAQAQGDLAAKKAEYGTKVSEEKAKSAQEITALEQQSANDQTQARAQAQAEVRGKKTEWSQKQQQAVQKANQEANTEVAKGRKDIQKQKQDADSKADDHIKQGNQEAERERRKAENKAAAEKRKGKKKSKGFFGWLASKAKAFFNAIKKAVKAAFDLARKLIKKAIEAAKKAAMWAIEQARKAIVAAIKAIGKALIAIGDRLLAAFPKLRDKFRKYIQEKVDAAVNKVNELADKLKKGVAALLDALAAGLDKLIGWLEKGMLAVIDAAAAVVDGAIKFAEKVAQALGAFVVLIKDIAAGPGQWLSNLAAGVVDGIKNHLWKAFKAAVSEWFNSKLEQVLGLGSMVWGLIKSGGLSLAKVGKMAWEGIKAMIPPTLTRILVEKLAAMIVPAAGAVMVIIEGLQAAWGAVQRIIAAFQQFFAFLKAVKTGAAGPPFAQALAAAAIAVIDFVANWLIAKLAKGASKIGGKIKALAKKILGRKKGKAKGRKAKAKPGVKPKAKRPTKKPSKPPKAKKPKKSTNDKKQDKQKAKDRKKQQRIERAKRELPPKIKALLAKKPSRMRIAATLLAWRVKYRLKTLKINGKGKVRFVGTINPTLDLGNGWEFTWDEILQAIDEVSVQYLTELKTRRDASASGTEATTTQPGAHQATTKHGAAGTMEGLTKVEQGTTHVGGGDTVEVLTEQTKRGKTLTSIAPSGASSSRTYREIIDDLKESGLSNQQVGDALGGKFANQPLSLTNEQRVLITEAYGLLNFEATHPKKTMGHRRDLVHALMQSQSLSAGTMSVEDLRRAPTAGRLSGAAAVTAGETTKHPWAGIQAGAGAVTKKGVHGKGYGPGELPKSMFGPEEVRLKREINNFKRWIKTTGDLQKIEGRKPTKADLVMEIKKRLDAYLARFRSD